MKTSWSNVEYVERGLGSRYIVLFVRPAGQITHHPPLIKTVATHSPQTRNSDPPAAALVRGAARRDFQSSPHSTSRRLKVVLVQAKKSIEYNFFGQVF